LSITHHTRKRPSTGPRTTHGPHLLCFLDCYYGYHQITIKEEDQEKTTFITPFGAYCYTLMSFGLKNVGATYQRAIKACFKKQLNKYVEAYVDDMVIVGEFRKTHHPRNVKFDKVLETCFSGAGNSRFSEAWNL
jgi:hypothetical protein